MSFVNAVARGGGASLNDIFPIGSVIIKNAPWNGFPGQTWILFGSGKTLVGQDENQSVADQAFADFTTLGGSGGDVKHTLLETEMPSHSHGIPFNDNDDVNPNGKFVQTGITSPSYFNTSSKGGDQPHSIMNPYQVVLYYRRTA